MLEVKVEGGRETVTEPKTAFDGLFSELDMAEKRPSELKKVSVGSSKTKKQMNKD